VGGAVAVATLGVLIWQNYLILDQNKFVQAQIAAAQQQNRLQQMAFDRQRRTELVAALYEVAGGKPKAPSRVRLEALLEFVAMERAPSSTVEISIEGARLDNLRLIGALYREVLDFEKILVSG
jgi:hypothetical protein